MEESLDKLGIIVLNYNSSELTIHAVECLLQLNTGAEIIVVDNCSNDNSGEALKDRLSNISKVHLVYAENNCGYAAGNNLGIHTAEKLAPQIDTFLIMNPDIDFDDPGILLDLYRILDSNDYIGAITAKTIYNGRINEPNECAWRFMTRMYMMFGDTLIGKKFVHSLKYEHLEPNSNGITLVDVVQGCFFMIRRDVFERVGLFDANTFLYGEESILAKKLSNCGFHNAVLTSRYIYHNHREKNKRLIRYENKLFDIKCFYFSRKYYINEYSGENWLFRSMATTVLNIDYWIKRIFLLGKKMRSQ